MDATQLGSASQPDSLDVSRYHGIVVFPLDGFGRRDGWEVPWYVSVALSAVVALAPRIRGQPGLIAELNAG